MNIDFFRTKGLRELELVLGLQANTTAIAVREARNGEASTYALAFFDHEVGKDFPTFALANYPIGVIKRLIAVVIEEAKRCESPALLGTRPSETFMMLLAKAQERR